MDWTKAKMEQVLFDIRQRAIADADFREELLEDPNAVIEKVSGLKVDPSFRIRIIEQDPAYQATYFLPPLVSDEFTPDELDAVAGGVCDSNVCSIHGCIGVIGPK